MKILLIALMTLLVGCAGQGVKLEVETSGTPCGSKVVKFSTDYQVENLDIGKCEPSVAFRMGLEAIREAPKADGVFISCTNFRSFGIIQKLSEEIGKPVVSSNQASLWMTLKTGGVSASLEGLEC